VDHHEISVSRRIWLLAGSLLGPSTSKPAPGVTRVQLGAVTATTLSGGHFARPLDANSVCNATLTEVQHALREAALPTDLVDVPFPLMVDVGGQVVFPNAKIYAPTTEWE
jgi:hypothetical protein